MNIIEKILYGLMQIVKLLLWSIVLAILFFSCRGDT